MKPLLITKARRTAGQPPAAPPGGGFTPTRGRDLPFAAYDAASTNAAYDAASTNGTLSRERTQHV